NLVFERAVLVADNRVALIAELVEISIVDPDILRKLELPNEACANHEGSNPAFDAVIRRVLWKVRPVGRATADHAAPIYIYCRVARIHAANVRSERNRIPLRIHFLVVEIVISLWIGAQAWIVFFRRQNERRPTSPAAHQLGGNQFLLFWSFAVLAQEVAE